MNNGKVMEKIEILPDALYSPQETGEILGFGANAEEEEGIRPSRRKAASLVYRIPARELPRTRVGPSGGKVMFRGRDILAYLDRRRRDW